MYLYLFQLFFVNANPQLKDLIGTTKFFTFYDTYVALITSMKVSIGIALKSNSIHFNGNCKSFSPTVLKITESTNFLCRLFPGLPLFCSMRVSTRITNFFCQILLSTNPRIALASCSPNDITTVPVSDVSLG